ncbi:sensor histidine kinase [Clostridium tertium]|uniref:sensor histidine kinase n=1 Tax=Clostridium tertium TaxID=1559 RepID=UPI00241D3F3B|nr:HAMP domain-containing sensor histidine kinase [Clostridium tertium]
MRKIKDKSAIVLIIYSIITLIIIIIGLKYTTNILDTYYKSVKDDVIYNIDLSEKDIQYNETSDSIVVERYEDRIKNNSNIVIIAFFTFMVVSNFILFIIIKKINYKNSIEIINNIESIEENEEILNIDPVTYKFYKELKDKVNSHIDDYKRLNSYLSHEQKNAIAILRTSIELEGNKKLLDTLDKVSNSVEDVIAISDIKDEEEMYEIDIVLICAQICDHYASVYKNLSFDFDEDSNMSILGKEKWIYRAISNILDNAIKYGEGRDIQVNVKNEKGSVIVSVKDNGIGMKKSSMGKIFNDRYRINELNKDGYGIGLSLVKHVCNLCDGFIWVESEENKGSIFYLAFKEYK